RGLGRVRVIGRAVPGHILSGPTGPAAPATRPAPRGRRRFGVGGRRASRRLLRRRLLRGGLARRFAARRLPRGTLPGRRPLPGGPAGRLLRCRFPGALLLGARLLRRRLLGSLLRGGSLRLPAGGLARRLAARRLPRGTLPGRRPLPGG